MVTYYLDASAMVKQYVNETGCDWLRCAVSAQDVAVITAQLLIVEVASALNRRLREGSVTAHDYTRLSGRFRDDCREVYQLVALDHTIIDKAYTVGTAPFTRL
jgi:predicted nucleic acid-binding protein